MKDEFGETQPTQLGLRREHGDHADVVSGAQLVVAVGRDQGGRCVIDDEIIVGRNPDCGLRLTDQGISRRHIRIRRTAENTYLVQDLGSRNGALVNDVLFHGERELRFGDRIRIGVVTELLFTRNDTVLENLERAQKLQTLGELAGSVAHDFNNLLGAVLMHLSYLADVPGLDDESVACVADAELGTRRAADLSTRLLAFARGDRQRREYVGLSEVIAETLRIVVPTLPTSIEVEQEVAPGLGVLGETSQLSQVLVNLCRNSVDAMPEGGTLTIRSEQVVIDEDDPRRPRITPGNNVRLTVQDTGVGMDEEHVRRMFEPFFTSKARGAGTGLGLATVYRIVDEHWGHIEVESQPGVGTTVLVYLPAAEPPREMARAAPRTPKIAKDVPTEDGSIPGGVVLVADDQAMARHAMSRPLERMGLEVVTAKDGNEALRVYADRSEDVALILLDLDMPHLDGVRTHRILRRIDADVRVLVCSGRLDYDTEQELLGAGVLGFLRKPFDARELTVAVRRALAAKL